MFVGPDRDWMLGLSRIIFWEAAARQIGLGRQLSQPGGHICFHVLEAEAHLYSCMMWERRRKKRRGKAGPRSCGRLARKCW